MFVQGSQDSHELDLAAEAKWNLSSLFLMNNAAKCVSNVILQHHPPHDDLVIFLLAGPGNNGNDTIITANLLHSAGYRVVLFLYLPDHASAQFSFLRDHFPYQHYILNDLLAFQTVYQQCKPNVIVDGLFGVGLSRPVPDTLLPIFRLVNSLDPHPIVYAIDIASGISADSGVIMGEAIRADITITFDTLKNGHLLFPGKEFSGQLIVEKIGFPENLLKEHSPGLTFFNEQDFHTHGLPHLPKRPDHSYKGSYGKAGFFGGSVRYPGALALSTEACLRTGTGLVYGYFPETDADFINPVLYKEVIRMPLSDEMLRKPSLLESYLNQLHVIGIGPGLGRKIDFAPVMENLLNRQSIPLVIDADGLFFLKPFLPLTPHKSILITPHLGEMSFLTGLSVEKIQSDLLSTARHFASLWQVIVVLKSSTTIIAHPDGRYYIHAISQSSLAKGGSGDLLTGILCGLVAQKTESFIAGMLAVYIHSKAAQKASLRLSCTSVLPSDILLELSQVFLEWEKIRASS